MQFCSYGTFFKGLKNKPSVFEPLKVYCIFFTYRVTYPNEIHNKPRQPTCPVSDNIKQRQCNKHRLSIYPVVLTQVHVSTKGRYTNLHQRQKKEIFSSSKGLGPWKLMPVKGSSSQPGKDSVFIIWTLWTLVLYMALLWSEFSCCYFIFNF